MRFPLKICISAIFSAWLVLLLLTTVSAIAQNSAPSTHVVRFAVYHDAAGVRRVGRGIVHRAGAEGQFCGRQSRSGVAFCAGYAQWLAITRCAAEGYLPRTLRATALFDRSRERCPCTFGNH